MPAWKSGSSTLQKLPRRCSRAVERRSDRASATMKCRRSQRAETYSRTSGSAVECGSNTYSTWLYSRGPLIAHHVIGSTSRPSLSDSIRQYRMYLLDDLVGIAELGDPALVEPERLGRHRPRPSSARG